MRINDDMLDKVLAIYKPGYRYLQSADMEYPAIEGRFMLHGTEYVETLQHLTDVEAQLCLNQLCYVFFGQGMVERRWGALDQVTFDEYLDLRKENMFIADSHKRFARETDPRTPFSIRMNLLKTKRQGNIMVAKLDFDLNDGAATGELSLVMKR